jgi:hypothetical protein
MATKCLMELQDQFVLPETLASALIEAAEELASQVTNQHAALLDNRDRLREKMIARKMIKSLDDAPKTEAIPVYAIDGGCGTEENISSAIFATVAIRIAPEQKDIRNLHCIGRLPHLTITGQLASGIMFMQEVMLANDASKEFPGSLVLIDGNRTGTLIQLNQFYSALAQDEGADLLQEWRRKENRTPAAMTVKEFESNKHLVEFLFSRFNLVGVTKLVSTTDLLTVLEEPYDISAIDDRALASVLLREGEYTTPIYPERKKIYKMRESYPYSHQVEQVLAGWHEKECPFAPAYVYFKPTFLHHALKIEVTSHYVKQGKLEAILHQLRREVWSNDIEEPYPLWLADTICKECIQTSIGATKEIMSTKCGKSDELRELLRGHRT